MEELAPRQAAWSLELAFAAAGFSAYFCAYAFRKPFLAAEFVGASALFDWLEPKTLFVLSQVVGYAASKFLGIKVCSETPRARLAWMLAGLVLTAELALVGLAALPAPAKPVAMLCNGLALGMVWGHVVRFLEGRRSSDLLLAALCASFVVSSGVVKDVGRLLLSLGIRDLWMPAATGALFLLPFLGAAAWLQRLPEPDVTDEAERSKRRPMEAGARRRFLLDWGVGLTILLGVYLLATAFRDFRDNYGVEILQELGYQDIQGLLTLIELPAAVSVLAALAALRFVHDSRRALRYAFGLMLLGSLLVGLCTAMLDAGIVSGLTWLAMVGLGGYLTYIPYNAVLFERLWASTGSQGTAVFGIYLADAVGYGGSLGAQVIRDVFVGHASRLDFFRGLSYLLAVVGAVGVISGAYYFLAASARPRSIG